MLKGTCGASPITNRTPEGLCIPSVEAAGKRKSTKKMEDHVISKLASRLERECACLSSSTSSYDWYIDSRASAHMNGVRDHLSSYQEEQIDFQIIMGNKTKCTPVGKGTVAFQTEAGDSLGATNVFHVPRLGMNLLSLSQLQHKGYDV